MVSSWTSTTFTPLHESAITSCQQDLIYAGGGESYARNILVADINNDGIDDLLCVLKEGGDDCDTKLRILSYDGEIRTLLEQDYLVNVGGGTKYAWMLLPDGSLASVRTSNGDNLAYFFTKYGVDTDGKLVPASKLCTEFEQDGSQKFFVDDKLADESDFARELKIYQAKDLSLILKTGAYDYDSFFAFYADFDPIAMTFVDALEFLRPSAEIVDLDKYLGEWIYHGENDMEGRLTVKDANGVISCDLQFYRLIGDQFSAYPISDTDAVFLAPLASKTAKLQSSSRTIISITIRPSVSFSLQPSSPSKDNNLKNTAVSSAVFFN